MANTKKQSVYEVINTKIIEALEKGCIPWAKPWKEIQPLRPISLSTNKIYQGANFWLLLFSAFSQGYNSPYWATFNQIKKLGGKVEKGEKSTKIIYAHFVDVPVLNEKKQAVIDPFTKRPIIKRICMPKYYSVFNLCQTSGIKEIPVPPEFTPSACSEIVNNYKTCPEIIHVHQNKAYYSKTNDLINLPNINSFNSESEYFSTLFHEMVHSTGHENRLNRKELYNMASFGDENYSKEELTAELGSAYLCFQSGISSKTIHNSASYLENWLKALENDKTFLVSAMSRAQRAADYILGNSEFEIVE